MYRKYTPDGKKNNYYNVLRHIGLKNYATFVDEYGNETGFLHFYVVNSKKIQISSSPASASTSRRATIISINENNPLNHSRDMPIKETFHCRGATTSMSASRTVLHMRKSSNDLAYIGVRNM